jgi:hypothetical protein
MELLKTDTNNSIGIKINAISFNALLRLLLTLPDLKIIYAKKQVNDEALAKFIYNNIQFEIATPLSDYWIEKPKDCPSVIFKEIIDCLEHFNVRWWHKIF